jgi:DNA mismatch endonuclease, patch repair protein
MSAQRPPGRSAHSAVSVPACAPAMCLPSYAMTGNHWWMAESWASSPAARLSMMRNRSRDTRPERAVRSAVHRLGLRYRVSARPLPDSRRTADLVFRRARVAIFIDGCFWHGCTLHYTAPASNAAFWAAKRRENIERDADTNARLTEAGWVVMRFWEHEDPEGVASAIAMAVDARRPTTAGADARRPTTAGLDANGSQTPNG